MISPVVFLPPHVELTTTIDNLVGGGPLRQPGCAAQLSSGADARPCPTRRWRASESADATASRQLQFAPSGYSVGRGNWRAASLARPRRPRAAHWKDVRPTAPEVEQQTRITVCFPAQPSPGFTYRFTLLSHIAESPRAPALAEAAVTALPAS